MARNPAYPSEKVKNPLKTLGNRYAPTRNISTIAGALNTN